MIRFVLILVLVTLGGQDQAFAEKRIALIIANSEYYTAGWDLNNPKNDALVMNGALQTVGFEVHTVLDASRDQMEQAFKDHGERLKAAGPETTGFFFFAGHGVQSEGLNYLIPVDAELYSEADVWAEAPRLDNLIRNLTIAGNARNFIVLDACRNNPLLSSVRGVPKGLATTHEARGTLIAYATAPGAVAEDGVSNSPFTTVLASLITEPGQSVESLFRRVRTRVESLTQRRQRPWFESGLSGEADYCFAGCQKEYILSENEQTALGEAIQANSLNAFLEFKARFPLSRSLNFVDQQIGLLDEQNSLTQSSARSAPSELPQVPAHIYDDGRVKLTITECRNPTDPFCRLTVDNYSGELLRVGLKVGMTNGWDQKSTEMDIYRATLGSRTTSGRGGVAWANIPAGGQQPGQISFRKSDVIPPVNSLMLLQLYLIVADDRTTIEFKDIAVR